MRFQWILIYTVIALFLAAFILCCAGFGDCIDACSSERF